MRSRLPGAILLGSVLVLGTVAGLASGAERPAPEDLRAHLSATPAVTVRATPISSLRGCATLDATEGEAEVVQAALGRWADEHPAYAGGGTVRVAFHVITSRGEGNVSDAQIAELMRVLDGHFAAGGYRFELGSVDRTENAEWFAMTPGSGREKQAKEALAIDPAHRLNLYTASPELGVQGWAAYPWTAPEGSPVHGVVLDYGTLPGGAVSYDQGRTAIHEVGHYLGLGHTDGATAPELTGGQRQRIQGVVPVYRPSLFLEPVARAAAQPEIMPGAGAEPEEGRVLAYRGAFPNPFRFETAIRFTLPVSADVSLRVYSVTGQLARTLVDATLPPGDHSAMFRAGELPSGAYFAVLKVGRVQMSRTLLLVR